MSYDPRNSRSYDLITGFEKAVGLRISEGSRMRHLADDSFEADSRDEDPSEISREYGMHVINESGGSRLDKREARIIEELSRASCFPAKSEAYQVVLKRIRLGQINPRGIFGNLLPERRRVH